MTNITPATWLWLKVAHLPDVMDELPQGFYVETGALCNLRCPFCPTGNRSFKLEKKFLKFLGLARFKEILGKIEGFGKSMSLFAWGEPLLNPNILSLIRAAKARRYSTVISTNLSFRWDARAARRLVDSGLDSLIVSADGATQENYRRYRVGGRLDWVLSNMRMIIEAKARLGAAKPDVFWQYLMHRGNQSEVGLARKIARDLGVPLIFGLLRFPEGGGDKWMPDPDGQSPAAEPTTLMQNPAMCLQPFIRPIIHPDGEMFPCKAMAAERRCSLGNVVTQNVWEVWNNPTAVAMRKYLRTGKKIKRDLPCYLCPMSPHGLSRDPVAVDFRWPQS
ncbi:MAG TPA: radical SAM/SPASM domain-containing protein [Elusimicrobiota bacterium]|nr:radical SAM/SPASM domain-containing protein [Elusimicrobiota bacterium]